MKGVVWWVLAVSWWPLSVSAADWASCKSSKREAVQLQQALRDGRKLKGYASGSAMKRARRQRDIWLRKHCRGYAKRLRALEREMM
ncbi:hypothetical protein [Spongiibacter sp.]|uniref:hypothetical protein n=1 Tax=Spongiibacter sp. TaxID=2024860 RepID=UPI0035637437